LPEASLIADKSSTAMFNLAGMQQLIPYLAGKEHPLGKRLFNIQKCVRTNDIDEVGDATHLTMFEMMGNRSLGDYFKKESITRSREFLTSSNRLWLNPNKLAVTVFQWDDNAPRDEESVSYWKEVGAQKISYLGADDNRRSPWPVWPCGPDTEIFYRVGDKNGGPALPPADSDVSSDPENWMEIWNNVFMEYYRDDAGTLTKLPAQNVDTGMGFERMCLVLQDTTSPYDTDIFQPAIHILEKSLDISYDNHARRMRIIADHCRTALSLIAENLQPSNEGRWYVLRMLIRRMYYNIVLLKSTADPDTIFEQLVSFFWFTEWHKEILLKEIQQFQKTLTNGQKEFEKIYQSVITREHSNRGNLVIIGTDVFKLYDTFGFPYELTKELAAEKWLAVDEDGFHVALEEQKNRSRQATKGKFTLDVDRSAHVQGIPATQFVWYDSLMLEKPTLLKDFNVNNQRVLIFDHTPFYAEGGWQTGDRGMVTLDWWETLHIADVKKYEGVFLHFVW
jgi:alanyl-tRNA synthetase